MAYLNLHLLFPKKTDKIKSNISAPLRQRLIKEEIEKVGPILKAQELAQKKMQNKIPVQGHVNVTANNNNNGNAGGNRNSSASVTHNNLTPNAAGNASTSSTTSATGDVLTEAEREKLIIISPVKIANLRARRMSCEDSAVASIQALIRGRKSRRQTMSMQMGGDYDVVDDDGDSGALKTAAVIPNTPNRNSSFSEYKDLSFSPSLTSRAPFSGIADNPSKIAKCHKDFTIDDENSILGLLKVKTSLMMKFLDEQLSLIEEIEKEGKGNINKKKSAISKNKQKYITTVERILSISSSEIDINKEFQVRLVKLLP